MTTIIYAYTYNVIIKTRIYIRMNTMQYIIQAQSTVMVTFWGKRCAYLWLCVCVCVCNNRREVNTELTAKKKKLIKTMQREKERKGKRKRRRRRKMCTRFVMHLVKRTRAKIKRITFKQDFWFWNFCVRPNTLSRRCNGGPRSKRNHS